VPPRSARSPYECARFRATFQTDRAIHGRISASPEKVLKLIGHVSAAVSLAVTSYREIGQFIVSIDRRGFRRAESAVHGPFIIIRWTLRRNLPPSIDIVICERVLSASPDAAAALQAVTE